MKKLIISLVLGVLSYNLVFSQEFCASEPVFKYDLEQKLPLPQHRLPNIKYLSQPGR